LARIDFEATRKTADPQAASRHAIPGNARPTPAVPDTALAAAMLKAFARKAVQR
jgi:hypothetical protein